MSDLNSKRRRFLTAGLGAVAAVAGCATTSDRQDGDLRVRSTARLPERTIRNRKRCFVTEGLLRRHNITVGDQIRIIRSDAPMYYANFTIKDALAAASSQAPTLWLNRDGQQILGTDAPFWVKIRLPSIRSGLSPSEAERQVEITEQLDDLESGRVAITAPHSGDIEPHTGQQALTCSQTLRENGTTPTSYRVLGFGDNVMGAFERWHITSTDISPRSYPGFRHLLDREYSFAVSFHGLANDRVVIGGQAPRSIKLAVKRTLNERVEVPVLIAGENGEMRVGGQSSQNFVNRIAPGASLQIEQSLGARRTHGDVIANEIGQAVSHHLHEGGD